MYEFDCALLPWQANIFELRRSKSRLNIKLPRPTSLYIQSFGRKEIAALIRQSDLKQFQTTLTTVSQAAIIEDALSCAANHFAAGCAIASFRIRDRSVCKISNLAHLLVIRKIASNLKHIVQPKMSSRNDLVNSLRCLFEERVPFRLYRLDLRRFYDSFDPANVIDRVDRLELLSQKTKSLFKRLMALYEQIGGNGIPSGLEISSVAAEMMMTSFDSLVLGAPGVFFYGRFVDDMVIVTKGDELQSDFLTSLREYLPKGIELSRNPKKYKIINFPEVGAGPLDVRVIEYLGYRFQVTTPNSKTAKRTVAIDYSSQTVNRIKTRIVRSFLMFGKDANFSLLELRIAYLTANFRMLDSRTNIPKLVGVYHNHPHLHVENNCGLAKLDAFLGRMIQHPGRASSVSKTTLTASQKALLVRHSFVRGFRERRYHHFTMLELSKLSQCWSYAK